MDCGVRHNPAITLHARVCVTPWTEAHQASLSMGFLQTRILAWVAMPSSSGSSQPRDPTCVSCIAGKFFSTSPQGSTTLHGQPPILPICKGIKMMAGWHHWLDGHESEWTLWVGDGQGGLACCDSCRRKESDTTERLNWTELVAQMVKHLSAMQETWVRSLGWEDHLEKEMATHSSIHAWKIPCTAEPDRLLSMGSRRVRHNWATSLSLSNTLQVCYSQVLP